MTLALATTLAGFALTAAVTPALIRWLRANQLGKAIRVDGPDHASKAGTPTMGGLGMLLAIALVGAVLAASGWSLRAAVLVLGTMLSFAVLGLVDDLAGLAAQRADAERGVGLSARQMFALQVVAASGTAGLWVATEPGGLPSTVPTAAWFALAVLAVVGTANGVNITDGLDGLAAGTGALAFAALGAVIASTGARHSAAFAVGAAGACLGFLLYNHHPAQVFMGNVASLALGAGLATLALITGTWPVLPVVGAVFVINVLSVLIQVGYFKWSGGRRVFRMAPLHHHFELGGWHETHVTRVFWLIGLLAGLVGLVLARP